ncbi:hypothetical protein GRI42_06660 [Erythrobacter gaetbuli]|uniref:PilZ domain-containing protein n=1 Tax=Qipengyuania gaetbuli TaxID=266952 RepID=A0A844Y1J7_9SPHN|nr:PilZ domain-containing protein [Qipengyuania gaetbuli]MXO50982.1 hypothetical protein [Qipengyuania gaetbuli]
MQQSLVRSHLDRSSSYGMPNLSLRPDPQHSWGLTERRHATRKIRTFMPACVETDSGTIIALLKDFSGHGAGFESDQSFSVGQRVRYRWGDEAFREAKVIWIDGNRFGVENTEPSDAVALNPKNYRSVRVDLNVPAVVFVGEKRYEGEVINFAQKGLCVRINGRIERGSLATVKVGRRYFENVTARWVEGDRVGFALSSSLPIQEMSKLASGD